MKVLVLNAGSTSIKFDLYEMDAEERLAHGIRERVGTAAAGVERALGDIVGELGARLDGLAAVGHRVVHGGERLIRPTRDRRHGRGGDRGVRGVRAAPQPGQPARHPRRQRAVSRRPARRGVRHRVPRARCRSTRSSTALPHELYLERRRAPLRLPRPEPPVHGRVRRRGAPAHRSRRGCGSSPATSAAARASPRSTAAISIDTSMGMTPLEGLVMGTRARRSRSRRSRCSLARDGHVHRRDRRPAQPASPGSPASRASAPTSATSQAAAERGDARARLAIDVFVHRLRKYIGAYAAELGGADAIVFTGGIGENSAEVRERVVRALGFMGVALDRERNADGAARGHRRRRRCRGAPRADAGSSSSTPTRSA